MIKVDYSKYERHDVLCLDCRSFFASISAVQLGLDPINSFICVVSDTQRPGSVVLAASPAMKRDYKIGTGSRLYEIPRDPKIHIVNARMQDYLDISIGITKIYNEFAPLDAIHVYSIDEAFLNCDGSKKLFGLPEEIAQKIQNRVMDKYGIPLSVGHGNNFFQAKVILDVMGKKLGFASVSYETFAQKLHYVRLKKIWGIGSKMEKNLNRMGIRTLGQLANYPVDPLKKKFGKIGEQLWFHAHGIDEIFHPNQKGDSFEYQKGFGSGVTLLRDYTDELEIKASILYQVEEVCRKARKQNKAGTSIHLSVGYSRDQGRGGFSHSTTIDTPTNITMDVYKVCIMLWDKYFTPGSIVRQIHVSLSNITSDEVIQFNLFEDNMKKRDIGYTMDRLREQFGHTAIYRASNYDEMKSRSGLIGGHKA